MYIAITIISFESYKHTEISARDPITSIRLIVVYFLSVLILGEPLTANRIIGTFMIVGAMLIITSHNGKLINFRDKGILFTLISTILIGGVAIVEKVSLTYIAPFTFSFFAFLFPGLGIIPFLKNKRKEINALGSKNVIKFVFAASFLSAFAYLFHIWAYSMADLSLVYPIFSLSAIITPLLGIFVLKEKGNIRRKLLGAGFAFAGALVITLL